MRSFTFALLPKAASKLVSRTGQRFVFCRQKHCITATTTLNFCCVGLATPCSDSNFLRLSTYGVFRSYATVTRLEKLPSTSSDPNVNKNSGEKDTLSIMSWNCNGLHTRILEDQWANFSSYLCSLNIPDIVAFQEVRLSASAPAAATRHDHHQRNRARAKCSDQRSLENRSRVYNALRMFPFNQYRRIWSLSDWRYSGQLVLIKHGIQIHGVRFNLDWNTPGQVHHHEGRVIVLELDKFLLLLTYSCNQGPQLSSRQRRLDWDAQVRNFVQHAHQVYSTNPPLLATYMPVEECDLNDAICPPEDITERLPILNSCPSKPLVWFGDLNCALEDCDLTDPEWFRSRDLSPPGSPPLPPEYLGFPGCTDAERHEFRKILAAGHLVDAYRLIYPAPTDAFPLFDPVGPFFTWRGAPGVSNPFAGRLYGKGMRIDTALVHSTLAPYVVDFQIAGYGFFRSRFFGSDHTPVTLTFAKDIPCYHDNGATACISKDVCNSV